MTLLKQRYYTGVKGSPYDGMDLISFEYDEINIVFRNILDDKQVELLYIEDEYNRVDPIDYYSRNLVSWNTIIIVLTWLFNFNFKVYDISINKILDKFIQVEDEVQRNCEKE